MNKDNLLTIKNLATTFKTDEGIVKAVDGISFELGRKETLGIVGESGSGKSVTALSLMQLIPSSGTIKGEILYHAKDGTPVDLNSLPEDKMRSYRGNRLGMIFQEPMTSLNPVFTCGDQVLEAILLHQPELGPSAREKVIQLFEQVKLPDPERIYNAYPHQLSGGQKQRVMIAMAMCCNPDVLIADEPTTALDVTVQMAILDLMNELKASFGSSVIFITHDLGVIAEIADRVMVMYKGQIVEQGTLAEIFDNPQHPYTKGLLACRPPLTTRLKRLPVVADFMELVGENGNLELKEKNTTLDDAFRAQLITPEETQARLQNLTAKTPLVKVENLQTWFPKKQDYLGRTVEYVKAVDDVSFVVYPGETLGLVGESGCGKTTLGRSVLRLTPVRNGAVYFQGRNIMEEPEKEMKELRKHMQIIFQDPYSSLNPRMTVGHAIQEPMLIHGLYGSDTERKDRAMDLLKTVSLEEKHYYRYPHEFSGGQRQRVCIARALALDPQFIICDESVSALDVSVQAQVLNLLAELREQFQFTYIFISHDLSVVKFMSDRMLVMKDGKIEEEGPSDEVYNNPKSDYTRKLIDAIPKGR